MSSLMGESGRSAPGVALIVDDDDDFAAVARRLLASRGWSGARAATIAEACAALERGPVALILLDITLGDESGWEGLARLRKLTTAAIIVVTGGGADAEVRRDAELLGAQGALGKPFTTAELFALVDRAIDRRSRPGPGSTR